MSEADRRSAQISSRNSLCRASTLLLSTLLLAAVGVLDYLTGREATLTLFYLLPIATAVWFVGSKAGIVFCFVAAACNLATDLTNDAVPITAAWNASVRFGVYLAFSMLLEHLKTHNAQLPVMATLRRLTLLIVAAGATLAVAGGLLTGRWTEGAAKARKATAWMPKGATEKAEHGPISELASLVESSMRASRPVLLGSRDPLGPSCVQVVHTGDINETVPLNPGDLNGGPGTSMATLYYFDRQGCTSPMKDFNWHQTRLRKFLENQFSLNQPALEQAEEFESISRKFMESAAAWTSLPSEITPIGFNREEDWPNFCLTRLDEAVAAKDLAGAKRWSSELAAAAFSLADLHRWLAYLDSNHLCALNFQKECETLFTAAEERNKPYDPSATISQFPAGVLSLNGNGNYYEIERQAERMFSMPLDRRVELSTGKPPTPGLLWVPPAARPCFLKMEEVLSSHNQKTWEAAARLPYEHSYLVNMLYRATNADTADELADALKKFDAQRPQARVQELLSSLMYRGHSFAGLEWGDRFQPELIKAAEDIPSSESDIQVMENACRWTNKFYRSPATYGVTFTLRSALEQKRLDCVRATDMIGAIYRNAGRMGFGHVRWCSETGGHSVAAYLSPDSNGKVKAQLLDGLSPPAEPELWPNCYFNGHEWPVGLQDNVQPYAAELYIRGLDSYIWAEGYVIRGPNAGWFTSSDIPYSTHHRGDSHTKLFDGPYPQ